MPRRPDRRRRALALVWVVAAAAAAGAGAMAAAALPSAAAAADAVGAAASPSSALPLRRALADHLRGPHFTFWLDPKHYYTDRVVIQARRLYYLSTMAAAAQQDPLACEATPALTPAQRAAASSAADAAFVEMASKFRQPTGGWRFYLDTDPNERPQQVAMYGQVFALYALSTYAKANLKHSAEARLLAHATFDEISARLSARDGAVALESYAPDFVSPAPGGFKQNAVGAYGVKALGTHLHLTEALIAYRRLWQRDSSWTGGSGAGSSGSDKGWTPARVAASRSALERAARLLLDMRQGPLVLELRDQQDARRPAPLSAADGSRGQSYLPGHGVQAAFQLWDALEVLAAEGGMSKEGAMDSTALPRAEVLAFATAVLDGAQDLEVVQAEARTTAGGAPSPTQTPPPPPYRWLPQAYKPGRAWQLLREAEQRQADAALALSAAAAGLLSSSSSSSSSSSPSSSQRQEQQQNATAGLVLAGGGAATTTVPRKRIAGPLTRVLVALGMMTTNATTPPLNAASLSSSSSARASSSRSTPPARLPPPPRGALILAHPEVNWWTQMEHMLALLRTAKELRAGGQQQDKADAYVDRAAEAWRLLSERFADKQSGAFHWGVDRQTLEPNGPVSDAWKASYHSSRAMVNGLKALC